MSIPSFVMRNHDVCQGDEDATRLRKDALPNLWMQSHDIPLLGGKWAGLVENGVGNANFSDIV
jgi:hypothetical protein